MKLFYLSLRDFYICKMKLCLFRKFNDLLANDYFLSYETEVPRNHSNDIMILFPDPITTFLNSVTRGGMTGMAQLKL